MNFICQYLLLLGFFINYSYGRDTVTWVRTYDPSMIDESVTAALAHRDIRLSGNDLHSQVTQVVCKTRVFNGIHIKLYFVLGQTKWQCLLYKSLVQTLSIYCEKCTPVTEADSSEKDQQSLSVNMVHEESHVNPEHRIVENDDEAIIDDVHHQNQEQETNKDEHPIETDNQIEHHKHIDNQHESEKNADENQEVVHDNFNNVDNNRVHVDNMNGAAENIDEHVNESHNHVDINNANVETDNEHKQ